MRIKHFHTAFCAALIALSTSAFAQSQTMIEVLDIDVTGSKPQAIFTILDQNGDGKVSEVEWRLRKLTIFFKKDANSDNFLDSQEIPGMKKALYTRLDSNVDGKISLDEWTDRRAIYFPDVDSNKDGSISFEELKAYAAQ
jgi:hypothetical protein